MRKPRRDQRRERPRAPLAEPPAEDVQAFREAVRGTQPLRHTPRVPPRRKPPPAKALFRRQGEAEVLEESLTLTPGDLDVEFGEELSYRRNGIQDAVMRRLRRGHYRVEIELDLHGMIVPEAKQALREFLARAIARQCRCVRIIHGKGLGSGPRGPVIKQAVNVILRRTEPVVAFCSARQVDGGTGAIYVLLSG
ncbi:MAG: DNA mismatch repair protein MutS [Sinobacteraceae bacterium]|nr:DNA mismatch repair protein MutS [Nevskiaceae bacterium]